MRDKLAKIMHQEELDNELAEMIGGTGTGKNDAKKGKHKSSADGKSSPDATKGKKELPALKIPRRRLTKRELRIVLNEHPEIMHEARFEFLSLFPEYKVSFENYITQLEAQKSKRSASLDSLEDLLDHIRKHVTDNDALVK